jgi:ribosomal protein S18 acetylase RimI-like enzyme
MVELTAVAPLLETKTLAEVGAQELRALIREEGAHWGAELLWDFAEVESAVLSGLEAGSVHGFLARAQDQPVGYGYYLTEGGRVVVGSLFATRSRRGLGLEERLLGLILGDVLMRAPLRRVECQTLFASSPRVDAVFAAAGFRSAPRHYLTRVTAEPVPAVSCPFRLRPVRRDDLGTVAELVHRSHEGSVDAALNQTYATAANCRHFVETLVVRDGCGRFDPDASGIAEGPGGPLGVLLASRLSAANGHICQVSVEPEVQGRSAGKALLQRALLAFQRAGLAAASLSVTVANEPAYGLYRRWGFTLRKAFAAHAWVPPNEGAARPS